MAATVCVAATSDATPHTNAMEMSATTRMIPQAPAFWHECKVPAFTGASQRSKDDAVDWHDRASCVERLANSKALDRAKRVTPPSRAATEAMSPHKSAAAGGQIHCGAIDRRMHAEFYFFLAFFAFFGAAALAFLAFFAILCSSVSEALTAPEREIETESRLKP